MFFKTHPQLKINAYGELKTRSGGNNVRRPKGKPIAIRPPLNISICNALNIQKAESFFGLQLLLTLLLTLLFPSASDFQFPVGVDFQFPSDSERCFPLTADRWSPRTIRDDC